MYCYTGVFPVTKKLDTLNMRHKSIKESRGGGGGGGGGEELTFFYKIVDANLPHTNAVAEWVANLGTSLLAAT